MKTVNATFSALEGLVSELNAALAQGRFHRLTRDRRAELSAMVRVNHGHARLYLDAAREHPRAVLGLDVDALEQDLAFIDRALPLIDALTVATRHLADETLQRKARSARTALAMRRLLDGHLRASPYADAASLLRHPMTKNEAVAAHAESLRKPRRSRAARKQAEAASKPAAR